MYVTWLVSSDYTPSLAQEAHDSMSATCAYQSRHITQPALQRNNHVYSPQRQLQTNKKEHTRAHTHTQSLQVIRSVSRDWLMKRNVDIQHSSSVRESWQVDSTIGNIELSSDMPIKTVQSDKSATNAVNRS